MIKWYHYDTNSWDEEDDDAMMWDDPDNGNTWEDTTLIMCLVADRKPRANELTLFVNMSTDTVDILESGTEIDKSIIKYEDIWKVELLRYIIRKQFE